LASAHVVALDHLSDGGASDLFNVGTGTGYSNWDVIRTLKEISGSDFKVNRGPRRAGDPAELVADSTKLQSATGWRPTNSALETIIRSAWDWQRTHPQGYATHEAEHAHMSGIPHG